MKRSTRAVARATASPIAMASALATGLTLAVAAPLPATAGPAATAPPRHCFAEFTTTGPAGVITSVAYEDRRFQVAPLTGTKVSPTARFVRPVDLDPDPTSPTMTALVVTRAGVLQSVRNTVKNPNSESARWITSTPVAIGRGWNVRDIAIPGVIPSPYLFTASTGSTVGRYTFRTDAKKNLAIRGAGSVRPAGATHLRSLTWSRETTVRGSHADVLLALDGARLLEITVPRVAKPRVTTRVLASRGWGAVSRIHAGACFTNGSDTAVLTRATPILGQVGRSVRLYVDADNRNGSGRDIRNHGQVGTWP